MSLRETVLQLFGRDAPRQVEREYGRDSLLVWANLLLAPLFAALGLRLGSSLRSNSWLALRRAPPRCGSAAISSLRSKHSN